MILASPHFTDLYVDVLKCLLSELTPHSKPRGLVTKEHLGAYLKLQKADNNLLVSPVRKLSYPFSIAEFSWIMSGSNDVDLIAPYNSAMRNFSDDGRYLAGAYGPKLVDQLPYILKTLRADPWSRQAVLTLWRERPMESSDTPCTLTMQFFLRPDKYDGVCLHMAVNMRSNDAWLGLPYDVFTFTMIQKYVAGMLQASAGEYHHFVGSMHLYEKDWDKARHVIAESPGVLWRPRTSEIPEVPKDYKALFPALTYMARHATGVEDMISWLDMANQMPQPWGDFLKVLGYRFHKDITQLPNPWHELITGRTEQ